MNTAEPRPVRTKSACTLNNQFYDSSCGESSSNNGSTSDTTSLEVWRLLKSIKENPTLQIPNIEVKECKEESVTPSGYEVSSTNPLNPLVQPADDSKIFDYKMFGEEEKNKSIFRSMVDSFRSRPKIQDPGVRNNYIRYAVIFLLAIFWVFSTATLFEKKEKISNVHQLMVTKHETKTFWIPEPTKTDLLSLVLDGAFIPSYYANLSTKYVEVWIEAYEKKTGLEGSLQNLRIVSEKFKLAIVSESMAKKVADDETVPNLQVKQIIAVNGSRFTADTHLRVQLRTNLKTSFPVSLVYDLSVVDMENGVIYAALVLGLLYFLIIFEVIHRTLAGMLVAAISVAILAALDERPSVAVLASWIDFETILLLFSMMVLVAVFSETGIFDYMSVCTYRLTNGRMWPLINTLCFATFIVSSFLDNVTTGLLMTPVTIRLCEVSEIDPVPVLMAMTIFSNMGGAVTPVGDPPNVIVISNPEVAKAGVTFGVFFVNMGIGISMAAVVVYLYIRFYFNRSKTLYCKEPPQVQDLRKEIAIWQRAAASLSLYSKEEDTVKESLLKRVRRLLAELKIRMTNDTVTGVASPETSFKKNLNDLRKRYPIKNKPLLLKSGLVLLFVITVFFLHSIPDLHLSLGCTAFMGALLLLIIADQPHLEGILARVEWSTLLFFASLFILMEALSRLRLIEWVGERTEELILSVDHEHRLAVAIVLILWVSAAMSAFVDNIPLTTMMIRIVTSLANNPGLKLPLLPLVWSLCYGACLGGMATLIGSSSNVVCAGIAEQHGYRFSFIQYSKIGVPVTIVSLFLISAYLILAHVVLTKNF